MAFSVPMDRIARRLECRRPVNSSKIMNTNISNIVNRKSARWLVLVLVALMATTSFVGLAAADLDGTETEFYNDTTQTDANATDLKVTVNGTNGSDVYANYYRIDDNGTEVLESEDNILSAAASDQATNAYAVQTENTSAYRVVIHDNATGLSQTDVGPISVSLDEISGGGSLLKTGGEYDPIKVVVMFAAVVAAAKVLTGDD